MKSTAYHQSAAVHYTVSIHEADGRLARTLPRKRNLILDAGLDGIASRSWVASFTNAAVGTGTTPTKRDSGAVTVSRAGSTLTASAGFFEAADVGRLFKFDSGEEVRISAFTDATHVTTSTAGTIAAAEGTVWYVNQTALIAELKRTSTLSSDGGANVSTFAAGVWTHKRTFVFDPEAGTVTYREIGWSHTGAAGANLFGRDLLAGAGVTLVAGQQLRVVVELTVAYSPAASTPYASIATGGWTQNGSCGIEYSACPRIDSGGGTALEPSGAKRVFLGNSAAAIGAMSSADGPYIGGGIGYADLNTGAYTAGSFTVSYTGTLGVADGNSTDVRSIMLASRLSNPWEGLWAFRVLLDAPETKTSSQTLTLGFTLSWGRVLSNA